METKRTKVILLPTKEKAKVGDLCHNENNDATFILSEYLHQYWTRISSKITGLSKGLIPKHLYFVNDDKIKTGDWFVDGKDIWQAHDVVGENVYFFKEDDDYDYVANTPKKIIATTDTSLSQTNRTKIPQPSHAFVQKYCELGGIDEVLVEYDIEEHNNPTGKWDTIKVDSHNTITIHSVKDSWTKEELIEVLYSLPYDIDLFYPENPLSNWIEKNLH